MPSDSTQAAREPLAIRQVEARRLLGISASTWFARVRPLVRMVDIPGTGIELVDYQSLKQLLRPVPNAGVGAAD